MRTSERLPKPVPGEKEGDRPTEAGAREGVVQVIARDMRRWFLMLGVGLGAVGGAAAYLGLVVLASLLASIVFVSVSFYFFLRYWPEDGQAHRTGAPKPGAPAARPVSVEPVVEPPRIRFLIALRDLSRREASFRISARGAERFAKVIRYVLRSEARGVRNP